MKIGFSPTRTCPAAALIVLGASLVSAALAQTTTFTFHPVPPGPTEAPIHALSINNSGNVVGSYRDVSGAHGFYVNGYSSPGYTVIHYADSRNTSTAGINDNGQIVGYYGESHPTRGSVTPGDHGFLLHNGQFTTIDYPGAAGTNLRAINNAGEIIGTSLSPSTGFLYSSGSFSTIVCPDGGHAVPTDINNRHEIVGICSNGQERFGFLSSGGVVSLIDFNAPAEIKDIIPAAINDRGVIVGHYFVRNQRHGFLFDRTSTSPTFVTVDLGPASLIRDINDQGQIIGFSNRGSYVGIPSIGSIQR